MNRITVQDFATSFGVDLNDFSKNLIQQIEKLNFNYTKVENDSYQSLILEILQKIDGDNQVIGASDRTDTWYQGWKENLDDFKKSNYDIKTLKPKFIRDDNIVRFNQNYIKPENRYFELNFVEVYRQFCFEKYASKFHNIYEFGCGTGFNLLAASSMFPDKMLYGSDFVQSSVDLVNEIAKSKKINLKGDLFNMLEPNYKYKIQPDSIVFTFGALEQLASKVDKILEYWIEMKPNICIHTEPVMELYEDNNLSDYLAKKFQNKRGYTHGLLGKLKNLESDGKIEILKVKRLYFGSLFMEGYNQLIWKPNF
jgi:hypothetical protein